MALILCLETSSKNCSVAISKNGEKIFLKENFDDNYCHGEQLHVLIQELLIDANLSINDFDAFALSAGPGSYTGLRIGASATKGFSFAVDKPIISISTLKSMALGLKNFHFHSVRQYDYFCPTLDSRRGEVYLGIYDKKNREYLEPCACEIETFPFKKYLDNNRICFFGPGIVKLQASIVHKNADYLNQDYPSAKYLCQLAEQKFKKHDFVDSAYFEPMYLKNFIPTKPK